MKIRTGREAAGWFAEASEIPGKPEIVCRGPTEAAAKAKLGSYLKTYCGLSMPGSAPVPEAPAADAPPADPAPKAKGKGKKGGKAADEAPPADVPADPAPASEPTTGEQDGD